MTSGRLISVCITESAQSLISDTVHHAELMFTYDHRSLNSFYKTFNSIKTQLLTELASRVTATGALWQSRATRHRTWSSARALAHLNMIKYQLKRFQGNIPECCISTLPFQRGTFRSDATHKRTQFPVTPRTKQKNGGSCSRWFPVRPAQETDDHYSFLEHN